MPSFVFSGLSATQKGRSGAISKPIFVQVLKRFLEGLAKPLL